MVSVVGIKYANDIDIVELVLLRKLPNNWILIKKQTIAHHNSETRYNNVAKTKSY